MYFILSQVVTYAVLLSLFGCGPSQDSPVTENGAGGGASGGQGSQTQTTGNSGGSTVVGSTNSATGGGTEIGGSASISTAGGAGGQTSSSDAIAGASGTPGTGPDIEQLHEDYCMTYCSKLFPISCSPLPKTGDECLSVCTANLAFMQSTCPIETSALIVCRSAAPDTWDFYCDVNNQLSVTDPACETERVAFDACKVKA